MRPAADVPALIENIGNTLFDISATLKAPVNETSKAKSTTENPIIPIKKSIADDYLICLVCGAKHKTLKRLLMAAHSLTPDRYRGQFALPDTYPIVAKSYQEKRSKIAKNIGLGKGRKR